MDTVAMELSRHAAQINWIASRFTAAKSDPAAGMVKKLLVLKQAINEFGGLVIAPFDGHGPGGASFGAPAAGIALPAIDLNAFIQGNSPSGAQIDAIGAPDTAPGLVEQFGTARDAFGIMAPDTGQGATFEENSGADSRTVVQGIAMDIENQRSSLFRFHGVITLW
jgi:hypothetical protein